MNQLEAACAVLAPLDEADDLKALVNFLSYAHFDARQFPNLMKLLNEQGIEAERTGNATIPVPHRGCNMTAWRRFAVLVVALLIAPGAYAQHADFVVRNGTIWTVDDDNPQAEAVAVLDGHFIYVGSNSGVEQHVGPDTEVIDLDGAFVTPGFYDNHVHFESTGRLLYGLNLLDVSDEENFIERIRDVHERYAPGTWITGGDWSAYETWAEGAVAEAGHEVNRDDLYGNLFLPDKNMIDGFTASRPVLVNRFDRKVYLANTLALEMAGIRRGQPDPEGIAVERNASGEPTGALFNPVEPAVDSTVLVQDNVMALFRNLIPEPSREQRIAETKAAWEQMAKVGVTSYCDITSDPVYVDIYRELRDSGEMTARARYRPALDRWESMADLGIKVGFGDDWIRFGATKAWIDGIMGNSSARFYEPYTHDPEQPWHLARHHVPIRAAVRTIPEEMQSRLERLRASKRTRTASS